MQRMCHCPDCKNMHTMTQAVILRKSMKLVMICLHHNICTKRRYKPQASESLRCTQRGVYQEPMKCDCCPMLTGLQACDSGQIHVQTSAGCITATGRDLLSTQRYSMKRQTAKTAAMSAAMSRALRAPYKLHYGFVGGSHDSVARFTSLFHTGM